MSYKYDSLTNKKIKEKKCFKYISIMHTYIMYVYIFYIYVLIIQIAWLNASKNKCNQKIVK